MVLTRPIPAINACGFARPHLVGIGGSGMRSLAELLRDLGNRVTGSDRQFPGGHCESNVPADCDALVYSPAIPADNPERTAAAALGIPQFSLVDVLAQLMRTRVGVCIAGTHGKSTTTALTAWILQHAGREPSAFIGATLRQPVRSDRLQAVDRLKPVTTNDGRSGWAGQGELFVVESCEYRRHFLQLAPRHAVILNIEPDHFDTFPDEAALLDGFRQFAARFSPDGTLLINGDCERCKALKPDAQARGRLESPSLARRALNGFVTFGSGPGCDWRFTDVRKTVFGTEFRVLHDDQFVTDIESPLFGTHNLSNVLAATALCSRLDVSPAEIRAAVREFPGISRRFAPLGQWREIDFFDDYAHHPTAVRATLETAKQRFAGRRVWCVFQPHQLTRTQRLLDEFAAALSIADRVLITPVFAAREEASGECERVSRLLVNLWPSTLDSRLSNFRFCPSLDHVLPTLDDEARPGDVVILMGAGDIERIGYELAGRISRDHADE